MAEGIQVVFYLALISGIAGLVIVINILIKTDKIFKLLQVWMTKDLESKFQKRQDWEEWDLQLQEEYREDFEKMRDQTE